VIIVNGDDPNSWANAESLDLPSGNRLIHHYRQPTDVASGSIYCSRAPASVAASHPSLSRVNMSVRHKRDISFLKEETWFKVMGNYQTNGSWSGGNTLTNSPNEPTSIPGPSTITTTRGPTSPINSSFTPIVLM